MRRWGWLGPAAESGQRPNTTAVALEPCHFPKWIVSPSPLEANGALDVHARSGVEQEIKLPDPAGFLVRCPIQYGRGHEKFSNLAVLRLEEVPDAGIFCRRWRKRMVSIDELTVVSAAIAEHRQTVYPTAKNGLVDGLPVKKIELQGDCFSVALVFQVLEHPGHKSKARHFHKHPARRHWRRCVLAVVVIEEEVSSYFRSRLSCVTVNIEIKSTGDAQK